MIWPPARRITGLVYVAAFALDEGESALDITGRFPGSQLMAALRPATSPGVDGDPRVFAADLPGRSAMAAAAAQVSTAATFAEKSPAAAWKTAPSWYIVATARTTHHKPSPARWPQHDLSDAHLVVAEAA